jgi:hypothetical protein
VIITTLFLTFRFIPSKDMIVLGGDRYVLDWHGELRLMIVFGVMMILQFIELIWLNTQKPIEQLINIFWLSFFMFQTGLRGISNYYQLKNFTKEMSQLVYTINLFSSLFLGLGFLAFGIYAYKVSPNKSQEKLMGILYMLLAIFILFSSGQTFFAYLWNPIK